MKRACFAEFLGTAALVFAGTGAIVINDTTHAITHIGVAMTFGLIVMTMIYTLGGAVIMLEAMFAGPICGASMNPARSLAPALVSGNPGALWIYLLAPVLGAWLAVAGCRGVQPAGCCRATA